MYVYEHLQVHSSFPLAHKEAWLTPFTLSLLARSRHLYMADQLLNKSSCV